MISGLHTTTALAAWTIKLERIIRYAGLVVRPWGVPPFAHVHFDVCMIAGPNKLIILADLEDEWSVAILVSHFIHENLDGSFPQGCGCRSGIQQDRFEPIMHQRLVRRTQSFVELSPI
jgi:hypothetical protein